MISIIIPVYNHAEELKACLASLERQTLQDFEVIVVDDGSTVPCVIPSGAAAEPRDLDPGSQIPPLVADSSVGMTESIRLIRFETNRGAPVARNEGFRQAKGEMVFFLDADAELAPNALARLKQALEEHPEAAFAYPSFRFGMKLFRGREFDVEALRKQNYIHTSALIRREAVPEFDESLKKFQDWDLFLTMAERGAKGFWVDEVLLSFKPRRDGISQWLPAFVHRMPWPILGWMPREIRRYREAEAIIRKKHKL